MASIQQAVNGRHASTNTIMHALYGYFYLGLSKLRLATIYNKHINTISNWIQRIESDSDYHRRSTKRNGQLTVEQREWLLDFYTRNPVAFLDEAKTAFEDKFTRFISISTVWRALRQHGLTWKVLERRAMNIKECDIVRFTLELSTIKWCQMNIQFLDEVSFDNRGMLRSRGYSLKGKKLATLLCFISVDGLAETFHTDGTFDRSKFVECCRTHAHSGNTVHQYPGRGSVWILDGAKIHCHPDIVYYLRSLGIIPIFLPAYCPFYNPIEYLFGLIKKAFKRQYVEGSKENQAILIAHVLQQFHEFDMTKIFEHCGWSTTGEFDPTSALGDGYVCAAQAERFAANDLLEFSERGDPDYDDDENVSDDD
ncbi:Serine/threonine-protein kinase [Phytophthora megakarya]|uniref:Serine/threonine-protein kinase n=1 Tax=Phytophthora megakarya TaxID=4795 RepID=A0A225WGN1_9STRA|nr:Serine/threonine-protein kinase [Phytophthora megakarya]